MSTIDFVIPNQSTSTRQYAYLGHRQALVEVHYGAHLVVDLQDNSFVPTVVKTGWWEPWIDILNHSLVKEEDVVVDVGSNFGYHTNLLAKLIGPYGKLFAFECNPALIPLLKRSIFISGFSPRVNLYHAAVFDKEGMETITWLPEMVAEGGICQVEQSIQDEKSSTGLVASGYNWWPKPACQQEVPVVTLDATVGTEVNEVDFLHMDAEGAEPSIVLGAKELIRRSPQLKIITEWSHQDEVAAKRFNDYLEKERTALEFLVSEAFQFYKIEPPIGDVYQTPPCLNKISPEQLLERPRCDLLIMR